MNLGLVDEDPLSISDFLLDVTGRAYLDRDFDAFEIWFQLPKIVGTLDGDRLLETREDLALVFDAMCRHFDAIGLVALHRRTIEASYLDKSTIQATFISQQVSRTFALSDEIVALTLLRRIGEQWKVIESRYATLDPHISRALSAPPKRSKSRMNGALSTGTKPGRREERLMSGTSDSSELAQGEQRSLWLADSDQRRSADNKGKV